MAVFTLRYKSIRLTKAGLHLVNVVEQVELGLKPAMWCSSFPTAVLSLGFATAGIATMLFFCEQTNAGRH
ncbi:MAG TPA: hypothetical protein VGV15_18640 [Terriglobales bacterium]|jgi:hypothetical protein|nr:hypothetical protein [Terriglobales bacterium]